MYLSISYNVTCCQSHLLQCLSKHNVTSREHDELNCVTSSSCSSSVGGLVGALGGGRGCQMGGAAMGGHNGASMMQKNSPYEGWCVCLVVLKVTQQVTRSIGCRKKTSRIKYNGTIGRIYFYISHFGCMTHSYRGGFPNRRMFKTSKFCKPIFRRRFEQPKYFRRYEYSTN